jgi:hypothetical protein
MNAQRTLTTVTSSATTTLDHSRALAILGQHLTAMDTRVMVSGVPAEMIW